MLALPRYDAFLYGHLRAYYATFAVFLLVIGHGLPSARAHLGFYFIMIQCRICSWTGNHQKTACPSNISASPTYYINMIKSKTTIVNIIMIYQQIDRHHQCVNQLQLNLWTHFMSIDMPPFPITCRIKPFVDG